MPSILFTLGLLLFTASAQAEEEKMFPGEAEIYAEIRVAVEEAEENLPPCAAMDRLWEVAGKYETPRSCLHTRPFWEGIAERHEHLRRSCRDLADYMASFDRVAFCAPRGHEQRMQQALKSLAELRQVAMREYEEESEPPYERELLKAGTNAEFEAKTGKEFGRAECYIGTSIAMQLRKKETTMMSTNFAYADYAQGSICDADDSFDDYERFQRGGEAERRKGPR